MYKSNRDLDHIACSVMNLTLPKKNWTHSAHFAMALWLIASPKHNAFEEIPSLIRRYNEATGVPNTDVNGYHETITLASLKAASAFFSAAPDNTPLFEVTNTLMFSNFGKSDWLLDYWSKDRLFTPHARREWVDPDLSELPF